MATSRGLHTKLGEMCQDVCNFANLMREWSHLLYRTTYIFVEKPTFVCAMDLLWGIPKKAGALRGRFGVFFCPAGWVATNKVGAQGGAPPSIFFLQKSGNDKVRGDIV